MSETETLPAKWDDRPAPAISETAQVLSIIERAASDPRVDIEKLERLIALQERVAARHAQQAFAEALAELQPELPVIKERGEIKIGSGKPQRYALWEDINEAIKGKLADHGFALSFRTGQVDGKISVTGILSHRAGHREETTMFLPVDTSGSKNAVQAIGSSTSYGKRYTAAALLNLTSRGEDDDGRKGADAEPIDSEQFGKLRQMLIDAGADEAAFCRHFKLEALADLPAAKFGAAAEAIKAAKAARERKKEAAHV